MENCGTDFLLASKWSTAFRSNLQDPILQLRFTTPRVALRVLKAKIFYSTSKNAPAYDNAGAVAVHLKGRRIGSWMYARIYIFKYLPCQKTLFALTVVKSDSKTKYLTIS
jgi:hypothetical protein